MNQEYRTMHGFSLIELMVGMAIGLFLIIGIFTAYTNGRQSQLVVDDQVAMLNNARFTFQVLSDDVRQAGLWGRLNDFDTASFLAGDVAVTRLVVTVAGECAANWADYNVPLVAFNGVTPYAATCTTQYTAGPDVVLPSDVLEVRYTLGTAIANANLLATTVYVSSDVDQAAVFIGAATPSLSPAAVDLNFRLVANAYYIADWSNVAGDGIPSLRKVSLEPSPGGPVVLDQLLVAGVENLQVQYGVDTDSDGAVNAYVDPGNALAADWDAIRSVQIWLVIRSQKNEPNLDTASTAVIAGAATAFPDDGWRRSVLSTVISLRNSKNSSGI